MNDFPVDDPVRRSVKFISLGVRHSVSLCRSYTDSTNNLAQFRQSLIVLFVSIHRHYQLCILKRKLQLSLFKPNKLFIATATHDHHLHTRRYQYINQICIEHEK